MSNPITIGTEDRPVLVVDVSTPSEGGPGGPEPIDLPGTSSPGTSPGTSPAGAPANPAPGRRGRRVGRVTTTSVTEEDSDVLDLDALPSGARGAIEAVLMVVEEPVDEVCLASALGVGVPRVRELLGELVADYDATGRGFELRQVAGGWRVFSRADYAPVVERFVLDGQTARLTQAALETLAIVAYRQPVSRARVGAIRGVNVDAVMRTLVTRGLVEEAGSDSETGAFLYRTTQYFLQRIGLTSVDELPALAPYLPEMDALDDLTAGGAA